MSKFQTSLFDRKTVLVDLENYYMCKKIVGVKNEKTSGDDDPCMWTSMVVGERTH